jgi:hypothetical protein
MNNFKSELTTFKNAIYTAANERTKTPDAAAKLDAVHTVIEHCHKLSDHPTGLPLEVYTALTTLYKQHLPKVPAKPKTARQWAIKAIAKKDVRYFLNQAHIEAGYIRATDGHRLHVAPTDIKDDGFYDAALNKLDMLGKFPDIERVTPSHSGKDRIDVNPDDLVNPNIIQVEKYAVGVIREKRTLNDTDIGLHLNIKYLNDALSNPSPITRVSTGRGNYPSTLISFKDGSYAVLMPVKA